MSYARRSKEVRGFVNFPVDDPAYTNTGEGGMFVRLVVAPIDVPERPEDEELGDYMERARAVDWMVCCGGHQFVLYDESFIGDDVHPEPPPWPASFEGLSREEIEAILHQDQNPPAEKFHFPWLEDRNKPAEEGKFREDPYASGAYLCIITLGSTGWSGWNETTKETWKCTYEDLTEQGKMLYNLIQHLYGDKGKIYLQTWLDT